MFFYLSKILVFIITPWVWIVMLILLALLTKSEKKKKRILIVSLIIAFLFSNSFIQDEAMRCWEIPATAYNKLDSSYDIAIVLGGMMFKDETLDRLQFLRSNDRLLQAIELYKKGIVKKILFTGGSGLILKPEAKEGAFAYRFLTMLDIPKEDIIIENESRNTRENALFTKKILDSLSIGKKYLLVTSGFHMRRSIGCFEKAGICCFQTYSTDRYAGDKRLFVFDHLFIPNIQAISNWTVLIHEMVGYLAYKIQGYA